MWRQPSTRYTALGQRDGAGSPSGARPVGFSLTTLVISASVAFLSGLGLSYLTAFYASQSYAHEQLWTSSLHPKTQWTKFKGRLMEPSEYRGLPSQSVDDAWKRYTWNKWFDGGSVALGVSEDAIKRSRKFGEDEWVNSTARLDEANGGGYLATLEIFHQLHCLDMLRRHSWGPEYYSFDSFRSPGSLREHLDHCIDMLRQVLMCQADTGLVLFHWVEGTAAAVPDFSTWHQCRDPEDVLSWALDHAAPISHRIQKPDDAVEMPRHLLMGDDW